MKINAKDIKYNKLGFDKLGRVFIYEDKIFRQVNNKFKEEIIYLLKSDLWRELLEENLVPETLVTEYLIDEDSFVLNHKKIEVVTYPHEWSFNMLKDAALCTLLIQQLCKKYNFELKDGHGYNILFEGSSPKFIDIGSFIISKNKIWTATSEFYRWFVFPLFIWSSGHINLAKRMLNDENGSCNNQDFRVIIEGINNLKKGSIYSSLFKKRWRPKSILEIDKNISGEKLVKLIQDIREPKTNDKWNDYHDEYYINDIPNSTNRFDSIIKIINDSEIDSIVDIAANQGLASQLIALHCPKVKRIVAIDYDSSAVDKCYLRNKKSIPFANKIYPVLQNFVLSESNYFENLPEERFVSECAVVLALTHHLVLSQSYELDFLLNKLKKYTSKYLLIEFMPLGLWDGKNTPNIPEWYTQNWFSDQISKYFDIIKIDKLESNRVLFFCNLKKN